MFIHYIPIFTYSQAQMVIIFHVQKVYNFLCYGRGFLMDIGKKLQIIRESKHLTRYRLTQMTGISGHHIKGIENGTRQPAIDTLQRLIEAMGLTMAEFFNDNTSNSYLSDKERVLLENFRSMNSEKSDALLTISSLLNK